MAHLFYEREFGGDLRGFCRGERQSMVNAALGKIVREPREDGCKIEEDGLYFVAALLRVAAGVPSATNRALNAGLRVP
jgi:hypothetical protein